MMTSEVNGFRGRFAPSPSGPLHFGSLVAALGSYLQAKSLKAEWLVRIEDIDTTRNKPGADAQILRTLEQFGLYWDQTETYQTQRLELYREKFLQLQDSQQIYACDCSRARIQQLGGFYDGYCQTRALSTDTNWQESTLAWRLDPGYVSRNFTDLVFGDVTISPQIATEHYAIKRRDGLFAYQWVVVIDDIDQHIGQVIRGADLIELTPRQQALCSLLGHQPPDYGHLPLAVTAPGQKLSKQNHATDIRRQPVSESMRAALQHLGQPLPYELHAADVHEQLAWALSHWQLTKVPIVREIVW